jgi:hypothetical protein
LTSALVVGKWSASRYDRFLLGERSAVNPSEKVLGGL